MTCVSALVKALRSPTLARALSISGVITRGKEGRRRARRVGEDLIGKKALVVFFSKVDRVLHDALGVKPQHRHRRRVLEFHHDAFGLRSDPQTRSGPPPSYCLPFGLLPRPPPIPRQSTITVTGAKMAR